MPVIIPRFAVWPRSVANRAPARKMRGRSGEAACTRVFARQRGVQRVRSVNFRAFDLFAFIRGGEQVSGSLGLAEMPRLLAEQAADVSTDAGNLFRWRMQGVMRDEAVAAGQSPRQRLFVDLEVGGAVWLQCQRCLHAYEQPLSVRTRLEVVRSESEADAAPLDDDEADVIVGSRDFDLISQIEDELLLALRCRRVTKPVRTRWSRKRWKPKRSRRRSRCWQT